MNNFLERWITFSVVTLLSINFVFVLLLTRGGGGE